MTELNVPESEGDQDAADTIRINQDRKTFSAEANRTFDELVAALEARWPDTVVAEPGPTE